MDFSKLKSVVAEPPAGTGPAASGNSPLQDVIREAMKDQKWRCYRGISTEVVGERTQRSDGSKIKVREFQALCDELKRAARQLGAGLNLRVKEHDGGQQVDVYYRAGEKRKYEKKDTADNSNGQK